MTFEREGEGNFTWKGALQSNIFVQNRNGKDCTDGVELELLMPSQCKLKLLQITIYLQYYYFLNLFYIIFFT